MLPRASDHCVMNQLKPPCNECSCQEQCYILLQLMRQCTLGLCHSSCWRKPADSSTLETGCNAVLQQNLCLADLCKSSATQATYLSFCSGRQTTAAPTIDAMRLSCWKNQHIPRFGGVTMTTAAGIPACSINLIHSAALTVITSSEPLGKAFT